MTDIHLSVIIPAYNEEKRLGTTLAEIVRYLSGQDFTFEILVVDDGSTDTTAEVVMSVSPGIRLLKNPENKGKGYSVRRGMLESVGKYRLFTDADMSTPIEEVEKFWPLLENGCDVVIASRALPESQVEIHQSWLREHCGRAFNKIVRIVAGSEFKDTQCGFKIFAKNAAQTIFSRQTIDGWGFDTEVLHIAKKHKLRVKDVAVRWRNSPDSRLRLLQDSTRMFFELLSVRWNELRGKYE